MWFWCGVCGTIIAAVWGVFDLCCSDLMCCICCVVGCDLRFVWVDYFYAWFVCLLHSFVFGWGYLFYCMIVYDCVCFVVGVFGLCAIAWCWLSCVVLI